MATKTIKSRIKCKIDTTENWNAASGFIPLKGEIIIYSDHNVDASYNKIPGIKIGDGLAYVQDLPFFVGDSTAIIPQEVWDHINNTDIHVSTYDRSFWNNKVTSYYEDEDEELILTKDYIL